MSKTKIREEKINELDNKINQLTKNSEKLISLYRQLQRSLKIEKLNEKFNTKFKLFSCVNGDLKLVFIKKYNSKGLTIAISNIIFEAYRKGWEISDWENLKTFIKKNNISFEGCYLNSEYDNEILDNIILIEMENSEK